MLMRAQSKTPVLLHLSDISLHYVAQASRHVQTPRFVLVRKRAPDSWLRLWYDHIVRLETHKRMLWLYLKSFCVVSKGASSLASPLPAVCKEWCLLHSHCKVLNSPCKGSFCQHAPMPTPTLCSSTHACSVRLSLRMQLEQVWSCQ